jgi:uncharacterized protein
MALSIAVLSDSHKKTNLTHEAIEHLKQEGAQYIIHAGDLEIEQNLQLLKNSELPYVSVFGNNDHGLVQYSYLYNINKEPYYFKIQEITFKLMHLPYYMTGDTDIVIYGHTHQFQSEYKNKTLFLNPGEVCARNKNIMESTLLKIYDTKFIVKYFFKSPDETNWGMKQFIYERVE